MVVEKQTRFLPKNSGAQWGSVKFLDSPSGINVSALRTAFAVVYFGSKGHKISMVITALKLPNSSETGSNIIFKGHLIH